MNLTHIKIGIAPIGWSNDDMPELGRHISFEQCIQEMALAEYQGCEIGHKFPRDPDTLHRALSPYQLNVASAWYSLYFTEPGREKETLSGFIKHMQFLKAMHADVIVVCECGHSIQGKPLPIFAKKPYFTDSEWQRLINGLHQIGKLANDNQMKIVYHHHMGTGISQADEIDHLMLNTDPHLVSLLFDTGHLTYAGCDPLMVLNQHGQRINHVHLKDIRHAILQNVKDKGLSFLESVKAGVFTVPGDGMINFNPIFHALSRLNYRGWWIVEAEQDPMLAPPLAYAKMARTFLRKTVGL